MTDQTNPVKPGTHGDYERRDIGAAGVLYFLAGLVALGLVTHFLVSGLYSYLDKTSRAHDTPISPLVTNVPGDARHLPPDYRTDAAGSDYEKYLKKNFPAPQLETDERGQLDKIRLDEADTLSTNDYIDKDAGTVRIPIDRAMELIVQRGLPVRENGPADSAAKKAGRSGKGMKP